MHIYTFNKQNMPLFTGIPELDWIAEAGARRPVRAASLSDGSSAFVNDRENERVFRKTAFIGVYLRGR